MKYLVILEGKPIHAFNTEDEAFDYVKDYAEELKARNVENVSDWLADFRHNNYSRQYTDFPELILPLDEDDLMKILLGGE